MSVIANCDCNEMLRIVLLGDLIVSSSRMRSALDKDPQVLVSWVDPELLSSLQNQDLLFANFEGAIVENAPQRNKNMPQEFSMGFTPHSIGALSGIPNLVLSLANNHIGDYGREGIKETVQYLNARGIPFAGVREDHNPNASYQVIKNGIRVSLLSFTDLLPSTFFTQGDGSIACATIDEMTQVIRAERAVSDLVFVSLHTISDIRTPFSVMPDEHQKQLAYAATIAGATVVFGHQHHGLQSTERLGNGIIFHGLGAFLYDPALSEMFNFLPDLYDSTQIHGGGIATLTCCKHGLISCEVKRTKTIVSGDSFLVAHTKSEAS